MKKYKISVEDKKTLVWWFNRKSKIDFDPPYQRKGGLWSDYDKAYLIDSIINGFDVPKLYLVDFTWNEAPALNRKNLMYSIIDGKQRMESMFDFIENKIALNDDFVYLRDNTIKAGGMKYNDLIKVYPELAENFREYNLSVVTIVTEDEETINELFIRLNRSKPLNGAEIRNAMKGSVPKIIRSLAEHDFFKECVAFSNKRGEDKNASAKILLFEYYSSMKDTKRKSLDLFAKLSDENKNKIELAYRNAIDNLDVLKTIFLPKDVLLKTPGTVPLLYWFIKNRDEKEYPALRGFLLWFESTRKDKEMEDKELVAYNIYNRSTNDEISFVKRNEILEAKFRKWFKNHFNKISQKE